MKLFYYKDEVGNFGDDLNPWLWDKLLPGFFDEREDEWLVGIGTLLNHKLPRSGIKHVFGSGFGYGQVPAIDESYDFICVRGPKTAEALGLAPEIALTDSAILIRAVPVPEQVKTHRFGFIPHYLSKRNFRWHTLCDELGFHYIDPEWSVDQVLTALGKCEVVICEAMHGAIVSDALRIPWIPVSCYDYISAFKWEDWLHTVDLPYSPIAITSVYDAEARLAPLARQKNRIKRQLRKLHLWNPAWALPKPASSSEAQVEQVRRQLLAASTTRAYLSADARCNSLTERYLEKLDALRKLKRV